MESDAQAHGATAAGRAGRYAVTAGVTFAVALVSVLSLWGHGLSDIPFTSDLVQPYLVIEDLLSDPASFFTWRHSPSPYVIPDMLFAAVLVLLPLTPKWMAILYGATLLTGYILSAALLISRAANIDIRSAGFLFALCLLAVVTGAHASNGHLSHWLVLTLFAPFIHTGALLMTLIALVLLERSMRAPEAVGRQVLLVFVVLVTAFSDALFVAWFVLPALLVLWLRARTCESRPPWRLMSAMFVAAGLSIAAERIFHGIKAGKPLRLDKIVQAADTLWNSALDAVIRPDWVFVCLLAVTAAILWSGIVSLRRSFRRRAMPFADALAIFLAISIAIGVLAPVLTSYFQEQSHWRYLLFLPLFAILKMTLLLSGLIAPMQIGRALVPFAMMAVTALMIPAAYSAAVAPEPRTGLERCLDAQGLTTGLGDYWIAKRLMFLSGRRFHIVQLKWDGRLDTYNYNRDWFSRRADDGSAIAPNFIIVRGLDAGHIEEKFGPPSQTVPCADAEIWLYDELNAR